MKEAAWHAIWIRNDDAYKHDDLTRVIKELEEKLTKHRDLTNKFTGTKMTAYDLAHKAAEFAEQTLVVFVKPSDIENLEVSGE